MPLSRRATLIALPLCGSGLVRAQQAKPLRLALDSRFPQLYAPFLLAQALGFWQDVGLDVVIDMFPTAPEAMNRVLEEKADLAMGDMALLLRFLDENAKNNLRATMALDTRSPFGVVGRKSKGLGAEFSSLKGLKIGATTAETTTLFWPLLAKVTALTDISLEQLGQNVREPALMSGEVDAILGHVPFLISSLIARGLPPDDLANLLFADAGVDSVSSVLVASETAQQSEEALQRFHSGLIKGVQALVREPMLGVKAVLSLTEQWPEPVLQRLMVLNIPHMTHTSEGFGTIPEPRFAVLVMMMQGFKAFKVAPTMQESINAAFLPALAERLITP